MPSDRTPNRTGHGESRREDPPSTKSVPARDYQSRTFSIKASSSQALSSRIPPVRNRRSAHSALTLTASRFTRRRPEYLAVTLSLLTWLAVIAIHGPALDFDSAPGYNSRSDFGSGFNSGTGPGSDTPDPMTSMAAPQDHSSTNDMSTMQNTSPATSPAAALTADIPATHCPTMNGRRSGSACRCGFSCV